MELSKCTGLTSTIARISLLLSILVIVATGSAAQELGSNSPKVISSVPETSVTERVRILENELELQNRKLEELQKTISEQQQALHVLIEKLSGERALTAPQPAPGANPASLASRDTESTSTETVAQGPTLEQRLAKVEGQTMKIGPLRVSGDFRLRFDGIFRSASAPGDPPLAHVQNARARYRLRLNFDTDLNPKLSFHGQLSTGAANNPLTVDQDFTAITARHPIFISEAWIDYHPTKAIQMQAGRVQEVFADNSRFLFDDDIRFNGFNEKYVASFKQGSGHFSSVEFRAGQYIFTNPNVAIIAPGSALARAGEVVGTAGRSANLFHQGVLANQTFNKKWSDQFGADLQIYRHPNQIQLASAVDGLVLLVQPGLGLSLSGPLAGSGNATTTPGGAIYTAPGFQIARLTYRLNYAGFTRGDHRYPLVFNVQAARNVATSLAERDAMLASVQLGRITRKGDTSYLYVFSIKGANSMISQVTDDDLGTGSGVNIRTNHFRFEYGLARNVTLQTLFYVDKALRNSGQYPNFFVPLGAFAPRTYRIQQQIVFSF